MIAHTATAALTAARIGATRMSGRAIAAAELAVAGIAGHPAAVAGIAVAGIAAVVAVVARRRLVVVTVSGGSMAPTLVDGDRLLVRRARLARVKPGRVVVLHRPQAMPGDGPQWMVKRLAAVVPPNAMAVLGDNAEHSHDSRRLGPLPAGLLLGVAVCRLSNPDSGRRAGAVGAFAPAVAWTATSTASTEEK